MDKPTQQFINKIILRAENRIKQVCAQPVSLQLIFHPPGESCNTEKIKQHVQDVICTEYQVAWHDVTGESMKRGIVNARHAYCYIMFSQLKFNLYEVADDICRKNHASVIHADQKIKGFIDVNDAEGLRVKQLSEQVQATIDRMRNDETETNQSTTAGTGGGA